MFYQRPHLKRRTTIKTTTKESNTARLKTTVSGRLHIFVSTALLNLTWGSMEVIRFKRLYKENWEIAFNEKDLHSKLNGEVAEIIMPAKNIFIRAWRIIFPLKGVEC